MINRLFFPKVAKNLVYITACLMTAIFLSSCSSIAPPTAHKAVTKERLQLCPSHVSNAPRSKGNLIKRKYRTACVKGIELSVAPAPNACLSSGYGRRGTSIHRAIDYQSQSTGKVTAAAKGTIIKVVYRGQDYGNWVIISHGKGVYSSYAHLKKTHRSIKVGVKVKKGRYIGIMGRTGAAARTVHLHYEVRVGNYNNSKGWWGLKPINPFKMAGKC